MTRPHIGADATEVLGNQPIRILLIEDNPGDVRMVQEMLADDRTDFALDTASTLAEGLERFDPIAHDAVLLDLGLPDSRGPETFAAVRAVTTSVPVVILTTMGDEDVAVAAVSEGAQDYLVKDQLPGPLLPRALRYAIERQRAVRNLQTLTDDLRTFVAHAAHDLRSPIATVAGLAETLQDAGEHLGDHDLAQVTAALRRQAWRVSRMITDLLDLAKVQVDVPLEPVSLARAIDHALKNAPPPEASQLRLSVAPDLPPVQANADRLERLLTNLLTNAYRYGRSHIAIRGDFDGTMVVLEVGDDGPGVPEDVRSRLFEAFARGSNSASQSTGLGLSIVRQITLGFGGVVDYRVDPRLGGACFEVRLPPWVDAGGATGITRR